MVGSSALGIVVCGDLEAAHDHQLSYLLQDCSAAIENLLLCAHVLGLGACWLGVHPREQRVKALQDILKLQVSVIPVACIAIGHPAETKEAAHEVQYGLCAIRELRKPFVLAPARAPVRRTHSNNRLSGHALFYGLFQAFRLPSFAYHQIVC
jgi:hypothetical protein